MIQLSLFVTRELALFAMVVKRHFPLPKILSKILTSLKKECFSSSKIDNVRSFYTTPLNVLNPSNPKHKSFKPLLGIFYGYKH